MKTAPFNLEKALAGHPLVTESGLPATKFARNESNLNYPYKAKIECIARSYTASGIHHIHHPNDGYSLFLALDDPPLSPEEQAVISAMRSGRKVTVEEPPKPAMPRRCWAAFHAELDDPWGWSPPVSKSSDLPEGYEQVQLIELTPEVSAVLLTAGIRWEDAPTGNPLPEGLLPLPEGILYLGVGGSFKLPSTPFEGWTAWADDRQRTIWIQNPHCNGNKPNLHYAAPADSEIIRLNSKP